MKGYKVVVCLQHQDTQTHPYRLNLLEQKSKSFSVQAPDPIHAKSRAKEHFKSIYGSDYSILSCIYTKENFIRLLISKKGSENV